MNENYSTSDEQLELFQCKYWSVVYLCLKFIMHSPIVKKKPNK